MEQEQGKEPVQEQDLVDDNQSTQNEVLHGSNGDILLHRLFVIIYHKHCLCRTGIHN
jgi:hypothetical protein